MDYVRIVFEPALCSYCGLKYNWEPYTAGTYCMSLSYSGAARATG